MQEHVPLAGLTTLGIGGRARYFVKASTEVEVEEAVAWAKATRVPLFCLGGGSNLLIPDEGFEGLVLQMAISGIERRGDVFDAGAGESWERFVEVAIAANCAGVECLAGIPGTVGGTPVQNVGAYGQEVAETIVSVRSLDRASGQVVEISREDCHFRYRASLFNTDEPGRYLVARVRFALRPGGSPTLRYAELARAFAGWEREPTLAEVAAEVRRIRAGKGMVVVPGEADSRSAGSFFKNPVIEEERLAEVAAAAGVSVREVPHWPAGEGCVKLPAAWLLERAGFVRGYGTGPVRISSRHTLALTNWDGAARYADVAAVEAEIVAGVEARFGVRLQREPVVLGATAGRVGT